MKRLNICIDIDGTTTEPYYWLARANEYFNTDIRPEDVTEYEIYKLLNVKEEKYNQFYDLFGKTLHKEAKIRFGAREVISKLYFDHQIHFVTAREEKMREVSIDWLKRHQIPMDTISLLGCHYKVCKAEELQSDIFIEDNYDNAIQLAEAGFDVLLMDCTYNKGILPKNVKRVKNWYQIARVIERLANQQYREYKFA